MTGGQTSTITGAHRWRLLVVLLLAVIIRLPGLTGPIADRQSWNQCSTATVIRNLAERDFNPFRPQWDVLQPGLARDNVEAEEAPIYPVTAALMDRVFGFSHAWPRLLSILAMILGSLFLYRLVRRLDDEWGALAAVFLWNFAPYPWFFGRTIMSDPWMVACVIAAAERWELWLREGRRAAFWQAAVAVLFAGLFKVFALYIGVLFLLSGLRVRGWKFLKDPALYGFGAVCLILPLTWIRYASLIGNVGNVTTTPGGLLSATKLWSSSALLLSGKFWNTIQSRLFDRSMTPVVSALIVAALASARTRGAMRYPLEWFAATMVFVLIIGQGHFIHNYYQLPFTPVLAAMAGPGLVVVVRWTQKRFAPVHVVVVVTGVFLLVSTLYVRNEYRRDDSSTRAGEMAAAVTQPNDLLLVLDPGATRRNQVIYHAHRRGWFTTRLTPERIEEHRSWGATAAVICLSGDQWDRGAEAIRYLDTHYRLLKSGFAIGDDRLHTIRIYDLRTRGPS